MKPIILMTPSISEDERTITLARAYAEALYEAGGLPLLTDYCNLGEVDALVERADGVFLPGGGDIDPQLFGEAPVQGLGIVSPMRDLFELALVKSAMKRSLPIFGICRGAQILNIALGGTVYQDINTQWAAPIFKHQQSMPRQYASHTINIEKDSLLYGLVGKASIGVNSFHHQAVSRLGNGVQIAATSADGVIEAIEYPGVQFCLGVQWHPELMTQAASEQRRIFEAFIDSCKK